MTNIQLITKINAPMPAVFDLARSVGAHLESTSQTHEKAMAGRTSGLMELGETVTWQGRHFGFLLSHQSEITAMDAPRYFTDEMLSGHFKSFRHEHYFEERDGTTFMTDNVAYETPYGILGRLCDKIALEKYMRELLRKRNAVIKAMAENDFLGVEPNGL